MKILDARNQNINDIDGWINFIPREASAARTTALSTCSPANDGGR